MDDLPPLPKGYMLAPKGTAFCGTCYWLDREEGWQRWGRLSVEDWWLSVWDWPEGPFYAIPKPRYTCPLEFSKEVPDG